MNVNEAFPSKYLSALDIEGDTPAVISHIEMEEFSDNGKKAMKPIIYFRGMTKGVVLNKTNATNISEAYGPETDDWLGKSVILFTTYVDFQGKSVEAIRVRPVKGAAASTRAAAPAKPHAPGMSHPPQFNDPSDPGFDPNDIR